ncbi:unnamed protein product [Meganyctiphanes norvegica]|uniref:Ankyrin repeat domain-containing protein n=1 Tax=Meganyctiphanes norvegica TaxID=48144 RepID=A0AAV2RGS9_MEGNR
MAASREGKTETVKLLLDRGADINQITDYTIVKNSALMIAVFWGHDTTAELLLESGADVNFKTNQGDTVLSWALKRQCDTKVQEQFDKLQEAEENDKISVGRELNKAVKALRGKNHRLIKLLLEKGADPNECTVFIQQSNHQFGTQPALAWARFCDKIAYDIMNQHMATQKAHANTKAVSEAMPEHIEEEE